MLFIIFKAVFSYVLILIEMEKALFNSVLIETEYVSHIRHISI